MKLESRLSALQHAVHANFPGFFLTRACFCLFSCGRVLKIATFTKMGKTQALVEFERSEDAAGALERLHGENIYSGCNKLSIQWSNLSEMSVKVNSPRDPGKEP